MLAITIPFLEKFACVVAGKIIGLSRHPDYFEYHYRLRDLKKIRIEGLSKFVRVNGQGQVESILLAEDLLGKGVKAEPLPADTLNNGEKTEITAAFQLVNPPEVSNESGVNIEDPRSPAEAVDIQPEQRTPTIAAERGKKKSRSKPTSRV